MVPRTQEPPQNLTALTGHQNSTFFVVLLLCLGMCACAYRTCQLRLGTRFTLGLSPSICCFPGAPLRRFPYRFIGLPCRVAGAAPSIRGPPLRTAWPLTLCGPCACVLFIWLVCWAAVEVVVIPPIRWGVLRGTCFISRIRHCCFPRHVLRALV